MFVAVGDGAHLSLLDSVASLTHRAVANVIGAGSKLIRGLNLAPMGLGPSGSVFLIGGSASRNRRRSREELLASHGKAKPFRSSAGEARRKEPCFDTFPIPRSN